jgi:hypothetical protein
MALRKFLILRRSQSDRLEGRTAPAQSDFNILRLATLHQRSRQPSLYCNLAFSECASTGARTLASLSK